MVEHIIVSRRTVHFYLPGLTESFDFHAAKKAWSDGNGTSRRTRTRKQWSSPGFGCQGWAEISRALGLGIAYETTTVGPAKVAEPPLTSET